MITCPKSRIRTVFLAVLWGLMIPLSAWAAGKGPEDTARTDESGAEQPGDTGKGDSKSDGARGEENPDGRKDQTSSSKSDGTGETEEPESAGKNDRTDLTGETERSEVAGRNNSKSGGESADEKNSHLEKNQTGSSTPGEGWKNRKPGWEEFIEGKRIG